MEYNKKKKKKKEVGMNNKRETGRITKVIRFMLIFEQCVFCNKYRSKKSRESIFLP